MIWLKPNNLATFVDQSGSGMTWVLGPFGVQSRPASHSPGKALSRRLAGVSITNHPPSNEASGLAAAIKADGIDHPVAMLVTLPYNSAGC